MQRARGEAISLSSAASVDWPTVTTQEHRDGLAPWVRPDEQCVALTRDFRLVQRLRGHRYSVDDMLVAHLACTQAVAPRRVLDLGCGIGSVLLMVAWAAPRAELVGLEVHPAHAAFARRNVVVNGCEARVRVVEGDLRDEALVRGLGRFDLVTGTPPYFDPATTTRCADESRAYAHWELRGGIEGYACAAARALAPGGVFVACAAAEPAARTAAALEAAGLALVRSRSIVTKTGERAFLTLLVASHPPAATTADPPLVMRNLDGTRTPEHVDVRQWFGIRCGPR